MKIISIIIQAFLFLFAGLAVAHNKVVVIPLGGKSKEPTGPTKIIFLSSQSYTGNLGGLTGADAKCQLLADNAGLSGTYKAWLSASGFDPITRIIPSTAPYVRIDGAIIANNFDDLTDTLNSPLQQPIMLDEHGQAIASPVWTATYPNGRWATEWLTDDPSTYCQGWTVEDVTNKGYIGSSTRVDQSWTNYYILDCSSYARLYCVEQ